MRYNHLGSHIEEGGPWALEANSCIAVSLQFWSSYILQPFKLV